MTSIARRLLGGATVSLMSLLAVCTVPVGADVPDNVEPAPATPIGTFGGVDYVQYDGVFTGETSTGAFRVPYRITAPADPAESYATVVVEPSHFAVGLGALDTYLGRDLLLSRRFVHAGIGWSDLDNRILDPTVPGTYVNGGIHEYGGHTDDEIITEFARALAADPDATAMVGRPARRYVVGFSDTSDPVLRLVESGRATGVFDLALPITAAKHDPQAAIAAGRFDGKVIVVNSEYDRAKGFVDTGVAAGQYRSYVAAGSAHIPDDLASTTGPQSSPATFTPELRARFLQGHAWVVDGTPPGPSTHLRTTHGNRIDRDTSGNTVAAYADDLPAPRLPFVELGEATYIAGLRGTYEGVKTISDLGFASHAAYLAAFDDALADQLVGGFLRTDEADAMHARAALCPPLTYTETYRDHHEQFVAIEPCDH